jgi:hypothetical protein
VDADGNAFAVVGNFGISPAQVTLPLPVSGDWKIYGTDKVYSNVSEVVLNLEAAEYMILVK